MSEIFNFLLLNNNQVEHIYIFKGSIVVNEGENLGPTGKNIVPKEIWNYITNLNVLYTLINKKIHKDDTIIRIKEKIVKYTDLNISTAELYFFVYQEN